MAPKQIPLIDQRIREISTDQLEVLKVLWFHFLETKEWPKGRPFRKDRGRLKLEATVAALSPIFVRHVHNIPTDDYYRLTVVNG
jgi:hypothetical protein